MAGKSLLTVHVEVITATFAVDPIVVVHTQHGYCGSTADFCTTGCQNLFGTCSGTSTTSTVTTTSIVTSSTSSSTATSTTLMATVEAPTGSGSHGGLRALTANQMRRQTASRKKACKMCKSSSINSRHHQQLYIINTFQNELESFNSKTCCELETRTVAPVNQHMPVGQWKRRIPRQLNGNNCKFAFSSMIIFP